MEPILNIVARVGSLVLNILRMFAGRDASDTPSRRSAGADDVRAHWATIAMW